MKISSLFTKIRAITRYFNDKNSDNFSNKTRVNQLLCRFFANFSQKYKNLTYNNLSVFFNKRIIDKLSYFEFFEFYKQHFNNVYSEKFKSLDLSNSVGVKSLNINNARKYPNTQDKLLHKYRDLSKKATKVEEIPYIIYAFVNKERPEDGIRIGMTKNLPQIRAKLYQKDSKLKKYEGFPLYEDIKLQGIESFKMIILDVQIGRKNAIISEDFFTISFNRDAKSKYGFDLSINLDYNKHVGDLTSLKGDEHSGYIKGIFFDDVNHLIERGYEMLDIAVRYGVTTSTILNRLKTWYSDQFGSNVGYKEVSTYLRTKKLIEYYSQGLMAHEIAKKFVKFDEDYKATAFKDIKKAHEQFISGTISEKSYSLSAIYQWTNDYLKMDPSIAYERFFIKPIVISLLQSGFQMYEAIEVFEAMSIANPRAEGALYDKDSLFRMLKNRLWDTGTGKSWDAMRDIFLEPIIENLIRRNTPHTKIDRMLGRKGFTARYFKRKWNFNIFEDAKIFFATNYLGFHEVNDFLD